MCNILNESRLLLIFISTVLQFFFFFFLGGGEPCSHWFHINPFEPPYLVKGNEPLVLNL